MGTAILLFLASAEYTSHSKFCSTCHYMKPFYQSWQTSSHSQIECSTCHYRPGLKSKFRAKFEGLLQVGRYWSKLYLKSKPWAEIADESCLRQGCHEKRLLEGQEKFKKIAFDHKIHFSDLKRGKRLRCTSCHSQIVQGEHITVTESTCFICHFKESAHYPRISDCSHCHIKEDLVEEKTSKFNHSAVFKNNFKCDKCHSQTIIGDAAVPRENCYKCHWEVERLNKYEDTDLMHSTHISSHKIECNQCHLEIQHKIITNIETIADCQSCHTGTHQAQKILYTGQGGKGVPHPTPNVMLEKGLSCKGCHIFHEERGGKLIKSETYTSRAMACESCHGKGFSRVLGEWQIATEKKLSQIRIVYEKAFQEIKKSKKPERQRAQALLEDASFNINIVERGKSVHNMAYSQELLSSSFGKIKEALLLVGSSYKPERLALSVKEVPGQCSNCHAGIEEITTQVFGLEFPHKNHLIDQKIQCTSCHSNARKHGEFISSRKECAVCHHQDTRKDCSRCHELQKVFYQGGNSNGLAIPQDIMSEAEVSCTDCHLNSQNQVFRPDSNHCLSCHDEKYKNTFYEWQNSIKNLIISLKNSIKEKRKLALSDADKAQILEMEKVLQKIELDRSFGVHNYTFTQGTLTKFQEQIKSIKKDS